MASGRGSRLTALALVSIVTVALAGCGGGGGKNRSSDSPAGSSGSVAQGAPTTPDPGGGMPSDSTGSLSGSAGSTAPGSGGRPSGTSGSTASGSQSAAPVEVPTGSAGNPCKISSSAAVVTAFGGTTITASAGTSGTGSSTCQFVLSRGKIGAGLNVNMSLARNQSAKVFAQVKRQSGNQAVSGVGQSAFYRPATGTLQFYARGVVVTMQATPATSISHAKQATLRQEQIALGKVIAAEQ